MGRISRCYKPASESGSENKVHCLPIFNPLKLLDLFSFVILRNCPIDPATMQVSWQNREARQAQRGVSFGEYSRLRRKDHQPRSTHNRSPRHNCSYVCYRNFTNPSSRSLACLSIQPDVAAVAWTTPWRKLK
jgi:hypothetical protein